MVKTKFSRNKPTNKDFQQRPYTSGCTSEENPGRHRSHAQECWEPRQKKKCHNFPLQTITCKRVRPCTGSHPPAPPTVQPGYSVGFITVRGRLTIEALQPHSRSNDTINKTSSTKPHSTQQSTRASQQHDTTYPTTNTEMSSYSHTPSARGLFGPEPTQGRPSPSASQQHDTSDPTTKSGTAFMTRTRYV